jgi:hypothetical protein
VKEDDHGQRLRLRAPSFERRCRNIESETLGVAEAVLGVRKAMLQEQMLVVDILGVSNRQRATVVSAQGDRRDNCEGMTVVSPRLCCLYRALVRSDQLAPGKPVL